MDKKIHCDMHVAIEKTKGDMSKDEKIAELYRTLEARAYEDDRLTSEEVDYIYGTPPGGVPLICIHMTFGKREAMEKDEICKEMDDLHLVVKQSGLEGYAHAENNPVGFDRSFRSGGEVNIKQWPLKRFDAKSHEENKKWDMHLTVPEKEITPDLKRVLSYENTGMYSISRFRTDDRDRKMKPFKIYTIQGVNSPEEGKRAYELIWEWVQESNLNYADLKLEETFKMWRVGNPLIVPPTIECIETVTSAT